MTFRHRLLTLTLIAALSGSLTACGGGPTRRPSLRRATDEHERSQPQRRPQRGRRPSDRLGRQVHPRADEHLQRCAEAMGAVHELSNEIYRHGKDTPDARETLQEYSLFWQRDVVTLSTDYDKGGLREEVPPKPLWTYATSVEDRPASSSSNAPTTPKLVSRRTATCSTTSPST